MPKMNLPHERTKAKLQSAKLALRVQIAERKEKLRNVTDQLKAMTPKRPPNVI